MISLAIYPSNKPFVQATVCYLFFAHWKLLLWKHILEHCTANENGYLNIWWYGLCPLYNWGFSLTKGDQKNSIFTFWELFVKDMRISVSSKSKLWYIQDEFLFGNFITWNFFWNFIIIQKLFLHALLPRSSIRYLIALLCYFQFSLFKLNFPAIPSHPGFQD